MVPPCCQCEWNRVDCLKKMCGPHCQRCTGCKVKCSAVEEQRKKKETMSVAWASSLAGNQEVSSSVPSCPDHLTKYRSLYTQHRLSNLESRVSEISYSGSPSMSTGSGGGWIHLGMEFRVLGSSMETWKTGWIARMESGSWRVNNKGPAWAIIS